MPGRRIGNMQQPPTDAQQRDGGPTEDLGLEPIQLCSGIEPVAHWPEDHNLLVTVARACLTWQQPCKSLKLRPAAPSS
eukprot:10491279-Lingulodinium_polyedra.AAC.1